MTFIGPYSKDYEISKIDHFSREKFIPLPSVILEQFDTLASKCLMGIFSEISHIWLAIDNRLILWNFEVEGGLANYEFENANEIILAVALITPKPGIFVKEIEYLVAVSTTTRIALLGLRKIKSTTSNYELCVTPLLVSSDDVAIIQIQSSPEGRVFMCGSDGDIYELEYQVNTKIFIFI